MEFHQVRINTKTGTALHAEKTERLTIDGVTAANLPGNTPLITLTDTQNVLLQNCWLFAGTRIFASIHGAATKNIIIRNNELSGAVINTGDEVKKETVNQ